MTTPTDLSEEELRELEARARFGFGAPLDALHSLLAEVRRHRDAAKAEVAATQTRVAAWVRSTFGERSMADKWERIARFVEEAIELGQAEGLPEADAARILARVYNHPIGIGSQEVGGVMVTLLAWAASSNTDLMACALTEIERIEKPETIARIREKQEQKAAAGTAHSFAPASAEGAQAQEGDWTVVDGKCSKCGAPLVNCGGEMRLPPLKSATPEQLAHHHKPITDAQIGAALEQGERDARALIDATPAHSIDPSLRFRAPAPSVPAATPTPADWYRSLSDLLSYWLLRGYQARVREGWEEGPTEEETFDRVLDVLSNLELDPHIHKKAVAEMLARPEQCWIHAPTAPAPRTYAEGFADAREMAAHETLQSQIDCFCAEKPNNPPCSACMESARIEGRLRALKPRGEP